MLLVADMSVKTTCFIDMKGARPLPRKQTVSKTHRRVELPMGLAARFELPVGLPLVVDVSVKTEYFIDMKGARPLSRTTNSEQDSPSC